MLSSDTLLVDERSLDTVFAEDFNFKGKIVCGKSVMIKGKFQGQLTVEGDLYLAHSGQVEGEIVSGNLVVQGKHIGNARVEKAFTLCQNAQSLGDVRATSIEVEKGAIFNGNFSMPNQGAGEDNV